MHLYLAQFLIFWVNVQNTVTKIIVVQIHSIWKTVAVNHSDNLFPQRFWSANLVDTLLPHDYAWINYIYKKNRCVEATYKLFLRILRSFSLIDQWPTTVSHRSEYTPHIVVNILLYLFMWQHWRNYTWVQFGHFHLGVYSLLWPEV